MLATATALDLTGLAALADAVIEVATSPVASVTSGAEHGGEAMSALPGTPSFSSSFFAKPVANVACGLQVPI